MPKLPMFLPNHSLRLGDLRLRGEMIDNRVWYLPHSLPLRPTDPLIFFLVVLPVFKTGNPESTSS